MSNREKYTALVCYLMDAFSAGSICHEQFRVGMKKAALLWGHRHA